MQNSSQLIYRKTAQGLAEIKTRSGGISARSRSTLIMVNGIDPLDALQKKMGTDVLPILQELVQHGYVEAPGASRPAETANVAPPAPQAPSLNGSTPAVVQPSAMSTAAPIAVAPVLDLAARLTQLRRGAVNLLAPYFGPDVLRITEALLKARDFKTYRTELATLESRLAIYTGRKQAVAVLAPLQPKSDER
jgi:hypothetical protein